LATYSGTDQLIVIDQPVVPALLFFPLNIFSDVRSFIAGCPAA
jgi:hypothetical protein